MGKRWRTLQTNVAWDKMRLPKAGFAAWICNIAWEMGI